MADTEQTNETKVTAAAEEADGAGDTAAESATATSTRRTHGSRRLEFMKASLPFATGPVASAMRPRGRAWVGMAG